jgi:hypothetical protein
MTNLFDIEVKIEEDQIVFVRGYPFTYSILSRSGVVQATQINEVCVKTVPYSLVVNNDEVLFLAYSPRVLEELLSFASRNNLRISDREDLWYLFSTPYLDTKFEINEKEEMSLVLHRYFDESEVKKIRRESVKCCGLTFCSAKSGHTWVSLTIYV